MGQSAAGLPSSAVLCHTGVSGVMSAQGGGIGEAIGSKAEMGDNQSQNAEQQLRERELPGYVSSGKERKKEMEKKVIVKYYFLQSILGEGISGRADTVTTGYRK